MVKYTLPLAGFSSVLPLVAFGGLTKASVEATAVAELELACLTILTSARDVYSTCMRKTFVHFHANKQQSFNSVFNKVLMLRQDRD